MSLYKIILISMVITINTPCSVVWSTEVIRTEHMALESRVFLQNNNILKSNIALGQRVDQGVLILGQIKGQDEAQHKAVLHILKKLQREGGGRDRRLNDHEKRISKVEQWSSTSKWLIGLGLPLVATALGVIINIQINKNKKK